MIVTLALGFVAGFFLGNGIPYYVTGSFGNEHGFFGGKSAAANVIAGIVAFAIAGACWHFAQPKVLGTYLAALLGMACVGLIHTITWNRFSRNRAK